MPGTQKHASSSWVKIRQYGWNHPARAVLRERRRASRKTLSMAVHLELPLPVVSWRSLGPSGAAPLITVPVVREGNDWSVEPAGGKALCATNECAASKSKLGKETEAGRLVKARYWSSSSKTIQTTRWLVWAEEVKLALPGSSGG